jgi:hypothetical protein
MSARALSAGLSSALPLTGAAGFPYAGTCSVDADASLASRGLASILRAPVALAAA